MSPFQIENRQDNHLRNKYWSMMGKYWFPDAEVRKKIVNFRKFHYIFDISSLTLKKSIFFKYSTFFYLSHSLFPKSDFCPLFICSLTIKQNVNVGISVKRGTGLSKTYPLTFDIFRVQIFFLCRSPSIINLGYIQNHKYAASKF